MSVELPVRRPSARASEELRYSDPWAEHDADPLAHIGHTRVPSAFRRKLHYALICTLAFLVAWVVFAFGRAGSLFTYLLPVLAMVYSQPTLGDELVLLYSHVYVTLLATPAGFACSLLSFSLYLLVPAVFLGLVLLVHSPLSILQKKAGMLVFILTALNPRLDGVPDGQIFWDSVSHLPAMVLMPIAPCIPGLLANLLPIPSLATFRVKRRLKFLQRCIVGTVNAILIGFANQDLGAADIDQLLDQVDRSITALSSHHPALTAELLVMSGAVTFSEQVKELLQVMREVHGILTGLSWTIKDIQPNKTHKLFFPYLDRPLRDLGHAIVDVMSYTISSMRQEQLWPCAACCRELPMYRTHRETPGWLLWLKKVFFNEHTSVPPVPSTMNDAVFNRLTECVAVLRQKYTQARLHILYGVLIEDVPASLDGGSDGDGDSDDEDNDDDLSREADFPKASRLSRLVSVDQEVFQDQERFGFMNIFARGTFVLQLSAAADVFLKLKSVVKMHYEPPHKTYWQAFQTVLPPNVFGKPRWPGWVQLRQPIKVASTITVASLLVVLPGAQGFFEQPLWALFTVCFIIGEYSASSFTTGLYRLQGTVIGAFYGYFAKRLFEVTGLWLLVLMICAWVFATNFSRQAPKNGYSALVAGFSAVIVVTSVGDAQVTAWNRIISTLFGVVLYLFVDNLIFPLRSDERLREKLYQATALMKEFLDEIGSHIGAIAEHNPVDVASSEGRRLEIASTSDVAEQCGTEDLPIELFLGSFNPSLPRERIFVPRRELVQGQLHVLCQDLHKLLGFAGDEPELWRRPFPVQSYAKLIACLHSLMQLLMLLQLALTHFPIGEHSRSFTRTALQHVQTLRSEAVDALDEALQVMADLQARRRPQQVVALLTLRSLSLTIERYINIDCKEFIQKSLHHPALHDTVVLPFNATVYSMTRLQKELLKFGYVLREIVAFESGAVYF